LRICILLTSILAFSGCRERDPDSKNLAGGADPAAINAEETALVARGIGDIFRFNYGPRNAAKPVPAVRAAFRRTLGCAKAEFEVLPTDDTQFAKGIFATPRTFAAWVRLSRDRTVPTGEDDFDQATIAVSVKLLPGAASDQPPIAAVAGEQDFILQNHPVFFAKTAKEFLLAFANPRTLSPQSQKDLQGVLQEKIARPDQARLDKILAEMKKPVGNTLRKSYWSVTPYRFGDTYAKYRVLPVACGQATGSELADEVLPADLNKRDYLKDRLARDLAAPACFEFQVQLFADPTKTPLDDATSDWDKGAALQKTVAKLTLAKQNIKLTAAACERATFTPWNASKDHEPVGSINYARKFIYGRFSACRREQNDRRPLPADCLPPPPAKK